MLGVFLAMTMIVALLGRLLFMGVVVVIATFDVQLDADLLELAAGSGWQPYDIGEVL